VSPFTASAPTSAASFRNGVQCLPVSRVPLSQPIVGRKTSPPAVEIGDRALESRHAARQVAAQLVWLRSSMPMFV